MAVQILAPVTAAAASLSFTVRTERWATGIAVGLAGAETADLQITPDDGKTWITVLPAVGAQLSVVNPSRRVPEPGVYRYNKGVTVAAVPIYVATEDNA